MAKKHLIEHHVKEQAVLWLAQYYQKQATTEAVLFKMEVATNPRSGALPGRADGLVLIRRREGIALAALEAKSKKTKRSLRVHRAQRTHHSTIVLGALLAGVLGSSLSWWLDLGILVGSGIIITIIAAILMYRLSTARGAIRAPMVIQQIKRYPANDHWIALSRDVYGGLTTPERDGLFQQCAREGIGLLTVSMRRTVQVYLTPREQPTPAHMQDFLHFYRKGPELRQKVSMLPPDHGRP
jgi:hypothetical protein